jgi:FkbM family methyltransferase
MLSTLKNSAIAWQVRRTSIWKRYRQSADRCSEIKFYERLISSSQPGCIIDVGANNGSKTEIFLNLASLVIAIEPDPVSARTLRKRFRWKPVDVCEVAISNEPGRISFYSFGSGSAFNTASADWARCMIDGTNHMQFNLPEPASIDVDAETLANIVSKFGPVKYLKIDTEGFEDKVLSTLKVPIPLISMEFNFPQMWDAMVACIEHLLKIDARYRFNAAVTEPPVKFEIDEWATAEEFVCVVRSAGWQYTELYARIG